MKTLQEIYDEKFEERLKNGSWMNKFDIFKYALKEWLTQYRDEVTQEDGTPDVKEWFYQCIDELLRKLE